MQKFLKMFAFSKICNEFEDANAAERALILKEKSAWIIKNLRHISIPNTDPVSVLVGFIIGSVTSDGTINEQEYLMIYPALTQVFGDSFNFKAVKELFCRGADCKKTIADFTEQMISIMTFFNDDIKFDIITLCLCVMSVNGRLSLKKKRYICRLFDISLCY